MEMIFTFSLLNINEKQWIYSKDDRDYYQLIIYWTQIHLDDSYGYYEDELTN